MGWTLYTPAGHEWWDAWIWSFGRGTYNDDRLAQQYLVHPANPDDEYPDYPINLITLDEAHEMSWDFVIATLQDNQAGFAMFAREAGATFVVQVGNTGQQIDWGRDPLVLNSSEMPLLGKGIEYHQEFDLQTFRYREPVDTQTVRCFVHLLPETVCWPLWEQFRALRPDSVNLRYGHAPGFDDPSYGGNIKPISRLADLMADSGWGWHDKPHGDGFGHVIHNWAAVGRPLIGHASHYSGRMAEPFWRDLETCIDLDRHSVAEAVEIVRTITPERHREMSRAIRAEFDRLVDYDREAVEIARLLGVGVAA